MEHIWNILLIEDDEDDYLLTRQMLAEVQGMDYTMSWAASYEEGRTALTSDNFDVILLDYDLGAQTGLDLVREFVPLGYPAPMILLTGRGSREVDAEAQQAGVMLYLSKNEVNSLLLERAIRYAMERKNIEEDLRANNEALQESDSYHRQLIDTIPGLVWTCDKQGSCDFLSQQWIDYTGIPQEQQLGDNWLKALHPEDRKLAFSLWKAAVEGRESYNLEYRIRRWDGVYHWFKVRGNPIRNGRGQIMRWFGTCVDIEDLKQTQNENRQQKERLEKLIRFAPIGIAFLEGPYHVYTVANEQYRRYAHGKGNLVGFTVAEKWPEISSEVIPQLDKVYETGKPFSIVNTPLQVDHNGDLEVHYFSYSYTPIQNGNGEVEGIMVLVIDTSEQVLAQGD